MINSRYGKRRISRVFLKIKKMLETGKAKIIESVYKVESLDKKSNEQKRA